MEAQILLACADPREGDLVAAAGVGELHVLGVGKTAAAARLTAALRDAPRLVLLFGICGVFPAAHAHRAPTLDVLDLCVVAESVLADDGVVTDDGFVGLARLGLGSDGPWRADEPRSRRAAERLGAPLVRAATVSSCSGTDLTSAAVAARTAAEIETMESAACAFVCAEHGVPLVEIRCVSNRTGARSAAGFRIREAAARAQRAVLDLLAAGVLA